MILFFSTQNWLVHVLFFLLALDYKTWMNVTRENELSIDFLPEKFIETVIEFFHKFSLSTCYLG